MHRITRISISSLATAGIYLMSAGMRLEEQSPGRMKNVICLTPAAVEESLPAMAAPLREEIRAFILPQSPEPSAQVQETHIEGGMRIKNQTGYFVDAAELLESGPGIELERGGPQILIIHTHSSEAYTQAGLDRYEPSDTARTEDTQFNVVRIGDELAEILGQYGLEVIHDRGIYDYPSYTGSYSRSGAAVQQYLESYPGIKIVLDIHRDALGSAGVVYKTMAEEEGSVASQIMLLCGSDASGLEHPGWQGNLALALYMQNAAVQAHPTLMRPVSLVKERYNQHLSPGSMIVEVGSSGNTLQEALAAIRLFGHAVGPELGSLVKSE